MGGGGGKEGGGEGQIDDENDGRQMEADWKEAGGSTSLMGENGWGYRRRIFWNMGMTR